MAAVFQELRAGVPRVSFTVMEKREIEQLEAKIEKMKKRTHSGWSHVREPVLITKAESFM